MKRLYKSYLKSLSSLHEGSGSWKSCVVDLWIVIGFPISLVVLLIGMTATFGMTEIDSLGVPRSGIEAFIATIATVIIGIPIISGIIGTIMWFDRRFMRWPWRKPAPKIAKK